MSKQAGFASFNPIAIIIAVVVAALAGGGYFIASKNGSAPALPGGIGGPVLNSNCKHNDPDLCKFLNNWKDIKNYSIKATSTSKDSNSESIFEISGEDRFHMVNSTNSKEDYNVITIGDTTYTKDYTDNKWWKQKAEKISEIKDKFEFKVEDEGEKVEDKTTYTSMGKEACSSRQCFKYQVVSPDMKGVTEYIWFDDKEYLLRKERTEGSGMVNNSEFSYDKVNVSEPSPTKEAKAGETIIPGGGAIPGFSQEELKQIQEESKKIIESQPKDYETQPVLDSDNSSISE